MTAAASPSSDFLPGELVQVTATPGIQGASTAVVPEVWQFRAAAGAATGEFVESGQSLGNHSSFDVALGDLDGDGDIDAFVANASGNRVWLNNRSGRFRDSGQSFGDHASSDVALGDLDGDGDLDAFVGNFGQGNRVWLNNGSGVFTDRGLDLGDHSTYSVALGDLDGDGDLDAYAANYQFQANRTWLNDGGGGFNDSGQNLGNHSSINVSLGDVDGDGDLDALAGSGGSQIIWLNDGSGAFSDSGQTLPGLRISLGDLDGDGDLDFFAANYSQGNGIFLNDGDGVFSDTGQSLGNQFSFGIAVGDVDGDGDLDTYIPNAAQPDRVWLNNGSALFADSGHSLGAYNSRGVALGDLDSDGDLDAFVSGYAQANRVWINQNPANSVSLSLDNATIGEAADAATVTAALSAASGQDVTVDLGITGTATPTNDFTVSDMQIVIPSGATSGSMTVTAVQDSLDEADETVVIDITSVTNGQAAGTQQVTVTILDDDEPVMPDVTLAVDTANIPEGAGVANVTASLSEATTAPVTVDLAVATSSTAIQGADYNVSGQQISITAGSTSGSVTVTAVQDETHEPNETVTLEISNVTGGNELGEQAATVTIIDDDIPPSFRLASFTPTTGGFKAQLSAAVDTSVLNLGDTQTGGNGAADATLVGTTAGAIAGSLVVSPDGRELEFLATGARLAADTYVVTLRSAENGFKDTSGNLLDGNSDGAGGDDFSDTFTVASNTSEIGVQDFVRGPGQELNLPANSTDGIPITIDNDGAAIRNASFAIDYNPALLSVTGVTPGAAVPAGSVATVDSSTPGRAVVSLTSPTDLPDGPSQLVNLQANVLTASAAAIYGDHHVLDIHSIVLTNAAGNTLPSIDNDGLHVAAFFGDVSGNGGINASDASQVARVAASLDSGFAEFLLTDPMILGDISGNGVINATDASMVARFAVQLPVDEIPPIPGGVAIAAAGRANARQGTVRVLATLVHSPVIHDWPEAGPASTALGFEVPVAVPHAAADAVMAGLENAGAADDEDELPLVLEDAVEQLSASQILAVD